MASEQVEYEAIKYFLIKGISPNISNNLTETPLHLVAGHFARGKYSLFAMNIFKHATISNCHFRIITNPNGIILFPTYISLRHRKEMC